MMFPLISERKFPLRTKGLGRSLLVPLPSEANLQGHQCVLIIGFQSEGKAWKNNHYQPRSWL